MYNCTSSVYYRFKAKYEILSFYNFIHVFKCTWLFYRLSMPTSDTTAVKFTGYHADPIQVQVRLPKRQPIPGKDIMPEPPPEKEKVQKEGEMYPLKWPAYTHVSSMNFYSFSNDGNWFYSSRLNIPSCRKRANN